MKYSITTRPFNKTVLSSSIAAALSIGLAVVTPANADLYEFTFAADGTGPADPTSEPVFTMLSATGSPLQNTSKPYYYDATWGYGKRTQINGSLVLDLGTGLGTAAISPFEFFDKGPATASGIVIKDVPEIDDPGGNLWIANMGFNWNGSDIVTQIVWDASGVIDELPTAAITDVFDAATCAVSGSCATPAADTASKSTILLGEAPIATSAFNTTGQTGAGTTLGQLSLGTDDGIGGSPMDNGPFSGSNANFDFNTVTLAGYNDTTDPELTLAGGTVGAPAAINLTIGDPLDLNSPGISVTCADSADGNDDITNAVGTNSNISFNVDNGNGSTPVSIDGSGNVDAGGTFQVLYTCTDNAGARAALTDDPNNPGTPTVPASNSSAATTVLTVNVSTATQPVITITGGTPTQHEACTLYTDMGATAVNSGGATIAPVLVTDNDSIIGTSPNEAATNPTIDYNITDGGEAAITQIRTVNVDDTLPPVITVNRADGVQESIESSQSGTYTNPTATAVDASGDCNPGATPVTVDTVDFNIPDGNDSLITQLTYTASDASFAPANQSSKNFGVTVVRSEPVITLLDINGDPIAIGDMTLSVGDTYTEFGMNVHDVQDGDLSAITLVGTSTTTGTGAGARDLTHTIGGDIVDTSTAGSYTVTYDVTDFDTNAAAQATRTITVADASAIGIGNFTMLSSTGIGFGGTNDVTYVWDGTFTDKTVDPATVDADGYGVPVATDYVMTISSPTTFSGFNWEANSIRVYEGPAKLKFDVTCDQSDYDNGTVVCDKPLGEQVAQQQFITMDLAAGEVGAHILFDWGSLNGSTLCGRANCTIDVIEAWHEDEAWNDPDGIDVAKNNLFLEPPFLLIDTDGNLAPPATDTLWQLVSTDGIATASDGTIGTNSVNGLPMVDGAFLGSHANFNLGPAGAGVIIEREVTQIAPVKSALATGIWTMLFGLFTVAGLRRFSKKK